MAKELGYESLYHVSLESHLEELDDISEKLMVGFVVFMLVSCAPFEVA